MNGPTFAPTAALPAQKPAPPRSTTTGRPTARPEPDAGGGLHILTYLKIHWLMILFCGTLLGGGGSYLAWDLLQSKFESTALLQVDQAPVSVASNNANQARTEFGTYVRTAATLIKSEFVLNSALREIKDLQTIKAQQDPIKFLTEELVIAAPDGSELIKITFAGHNPSDVKKIVDAVQAAFMKEVADKDAAKKKLLLADVERLRDDMYLRLRGRTTGTGRTEQPKGGTGAALPVGEIRTDAPREPAKANETPDPGSGIPKHLLEYITKFDRTYLSSQYYRFDDLTKQLPIEIKAQEVLLKEIEAKISALRTDPVSDATLAAIAKDPDIMHQIQGVDYARQQYLTQAALGNPTAPGVVNLKAEWLAFRDRLQKLREEKAKALEITQRQPKLDQLREEFKRISNIIETKKASLQMAQKEIAGLTQLMSTLPVPTEKGTGIGMSRADRDKLYDPDSTDLLMQDGVYAQLVSNQWKLFLEQSSPARVRPIQQGSSPAQKDIKKQVIGTVAAGLMGFVVMALGVVCFETVGRRVSSLGELKSAGPAPVVGVIPCLPGEAMGQDPARRAAANEAIDKLRTYVSQSWLSRGATSVAITSPLGDEGKAFTAFGLASSLAQAGYKTLLVDFDLRDPAMHTYAGVPNQNGVCEILRAETDLRRAVQALPNGLDLIPAGKWSDEARKAAVGGRLETLLTRLKEPYDCVILHAHALLTVAESVEVARRCEVVLVCAQYRETRVPLLRRATDRVAAMEIPYSGVVYIGATGSEALC